MELKYDAIIFDLGDVLFDWDSSAITALPKKAIHQMMCTETWHELERNQLSSDQAYTILASEFGVEPFLVREAFSQAQYTLQVNEVALELIQELIAAKGRDSRIKVYAMSNIAEEHFDFLQKIAFPWSVFDRVFTSFDAGMRKPDLSFFRHVILETGCNPGRTLYLDDKAENICAGRMLGLRGEIVDRGGRASVCKLVRNLLLEDASSRAECFLRSHAGKLDSVLSVEGKGDIVLKDNFAQLIIWGLTGMEDIIYLTWPDGSDQGQHCNGNNFMDGDILGLDTSGSVFSQSSLSDHASTSESPASQSSPFSPSQELEDINARPLNHGLWNYFADEPLLTTQTFPPDLDTTSIAYLNIPASQISHLADPALVVEAILANRDTNGLFETYFTKDRPRVNPEVCVSVLRFLNKFGPAAGIPSLDVEDDRLVESKKVIVDYLAYRAGLYGSRYYTVPEAFLYYIAMLCDECRESSPLLFAQLMKHLELALIERLHVPTNALALAMRVRACQVIGLKRSFMQLDLDALMELQEADGGWPAGDFCRYGRTGWKIGSRGMTTALVWRILKDDNELIA
ncbi:HAD-like domain-containing protein [Cladorrhinum sp. PSN332]|nr:HAD-like domain-containing protein [Cladorrhinum sp. PSN332]